LLHLLFTLFLGYTDEIMGTYNLIEGNTIYVPLFAIAVDFWIVIKKLLYKANHMEEKEEQLYSSPFASI